MPGTSEPPRTPEPRRVPCAGAVVHDGSGRLLLVRRANPPSRGRWSVPGGRVEPGESTAEAARRELREETGLDLEPGRRLGEVDLASDDPGVVYRVADHLFVAPTGAAVVAGDDATEAAWFTTPELASLDLVPGLLETLAGWDALPAPPRSS